MQESCDQGRREEQVWEEKLSKSLKISDALSLPIDAVTQSLAILAKRRVGKSYTARRFAEQLLQAEQQVVIIDPKGDWWGIRSDASGKKPGFPVVILGGEHGDLPLEKTAAETVARLIVEERVSVLLDLSSFRKSEIALFLGGDIRQTSDGLLELIYRLKAKEQFRTPMVLIVDEADAIAPQKPYPGEERMLGAMNDIVRRGGQRGLGCLLITQRSAVINKDVLTQTQVMIAMRTIAKLDLNAIMDWVDVHGDPEQAKILKASLPSLPIGDAWMLSPGWPTEAGIFERLHVSPITTFDSGATPRAGEHPIKPKNLADVDMGALKIRMADTIERAKADDPKILKARIAELERAAKKLPVAIAPKAIADPEVSKRAVDKAVESIKKQLAREVAKYEKQMVAQLEEAKGALFGALGKIEAVHGKLCEFTLPQIPSLEGIQPEAPTRVLPPASRAVAPAHSPRNAEPVSRRDTGVSETRMGKCERAILAVLAQFPTGCLKGKLALLSGYRYSGGFRNSLSALRTSGFMTGDNEAVMNITDAGMGALGDYDPLPTGAELHGYWLTHSSLGKCERAALKVLIDSYPEGYTGTELAVQCEPPYEYSGGFRNSLSTLRTAGLITGGNTGTLRASEDLF